MNSVVMVGRMVKDPDLKFIAGSGKAVSTFSIAVDRPFAKEKTADFFNVVVWGKTAENVANYLKKGREVAVKGYLQSRSYDDKEGVKRYVTEIVADDVQFIGGKREDQEPAERIADDESGFTQVEDDSDIPF